MSVLTDLVVVNRACARVGLEPFQSLNEDLPGGESAQYVYDGVVEFLLGLHPWSFARETRQLSRLHGVTPYTGYNHVFQLPPDRLGPPERVTQSARLVDDVFTDYALQGDYLHADPSELYALVSVRPEPQRWPTAFLEAATLAVAAELIMAIAANSGKRNDLRRDVYGSPSEQMRGGVIGVAIRADSIATPPKKLRYAGNPLTAHYRGG
ncbi:hypothetical protein PUV47_02000 [Pseudovibrio exalbescens]|uniref:hypothetical protein n=1 Tax=Pseudovibrio exalbescens TaxID=197461 RepID=UPI002367116E|nr:hypothetical protein [Pseudovibrio exalbescens]MDD7908677.1 hypothetical protein [Pseudovibrio exalbescens]